MKAQLGIARVLFALAGCGERLGRNESGGGSTTPPLVRADEDPSLLGNAAVPIRVGELGPGFAACGGRGATRDRPGAPSVPVRAAPYEANRQIDSLSAGAEFFICARTHDQHWFGIVYPRAGQSVEACGVGGPVAQRDDYDGPCGSGWVSSALVRLISGVPHQLPPSATAPPPDSANSSTAQPGG